MTSSDTTAAGQVVAAPDTSQMPQPLLDLPRLVAGVRWRRRLWGSIALLGLLAGALLAVLIPMRPTAVVQVLVIHEDDQPSVGMTLMDTDVAILESTRIASAAIKRLGSDSRPEDFLASYTVEGLTSNIVQLTVTGTAERNAVAKARALASAFIADHVQRAEDLATANAKVLLDQRADAEAELAEVDAAIDATATGTDSASPAELQSLYARRAELATQISDLGKRADEAAIGTPRVAAGTQIVDEPRPLASSLPVAIATNSAVGLVVGLVAGLGLAAIASVVQERPILRRDIAVHLGASVIAQLRRPRRGLARLTRRPRRAAESKQVARTLARALDGGQPTGVSLLELGCARTAAGLAVDIAETFAINRQVSVVDDLQQTDVDKLAQRARSTIRVVAAEASETDQSRPVTAGEFHIRVGSVAPGAAWTDIRRLGSETILVVRAGYAEAQWLHTVARQLADAAISVVGVVLVHPDPRDRSDGTLWDGLHAVLRGRVERRSTAGAADERRPSASGNGQVSNHDDLPTVQFTAIEPSSRQH